MNEFSRGYGIRPGALQSVIPPFTPAVKWLIGACSAVLAAQYLLYFAAGGLGFEAGGELLQTFGLVPHAVFASFRLWQLVTYLFLHGGVGHLLFNMLALWMFGSALESEWGTRAFLRYYFLTGVGAALVTIAFTPSSMNPTIGASGAIFGLLLAYGVLHPNRPIFIYGIFPVKAKWFVIGIGAMTLLSSWAYTGDGVAHLAHLGGMLFGYAYLKRVWRIQELVQEIRWRLRRRRFKVIRRKGNGDTRYPFH